MSIVDGNDIYLKTINFTDKLLNRLEDNEKDPDLLWLLGNNLQEALNEAYETKPKMRKSTEDFDLFDNDYDDNEKDNNSGFLSGIGSLFGKVVSKVANTISSNVNEDKLAPLHLKDLDGENKELYNYEPMYRYSKLLTSQANIAEDTISDITQIRFFLANRNEWFWQKFLHALMFANLTGTKDKFLKVLYADGVMDKGIAKFDWVDASTGIKTSSVAENVIKPLPKEVDKAILLVNGETMAELADRIVKNKRRNLYGLAK